MRGSCLCGGVQFELDQVVGPFELCHCSRCRKSSGTAFVATIGARREDFRWVAGEELVRSFEAPILRRPPAYRSVFCGVCGSPLPDPEHDPFEIPAGLLDDDPGLRPDKHIFVELLPAWDSIHDGLPQLDMVALARHRQARRDAQTTGTAARKTRPEPDSS